MPTPVAPTTAQHLQLRLGVSEWMTNNHTTLNNGLATQAMLANFILAVKHFNERHTGFVPDLASLAQCPFNLSIVRICDDMGSSLLAAHDAFDFTTAHEPVDALVGYSTAQASQVASQVGDAFNRIPLVSHWSSSPKLSDKTIYPNFFRTFPSDTHTARAVANLIRQLNYTKVVVVYLDSDSGPELADAMNDILLSYDVDCTLISFTTGHAESIDSSIRQLATTGLNVIIHVCYVEDLVAFANSAAAYGLPQNQLWIFTYLDGSIPADVLQHPNASQWLSGSLSLRNAHTFDANGQHTLFAEYLANWTSFDYQFVNRFLPPYGASNSTRCANSNLQAHVEPNFFHATRSIGQTFHVWAEAYDAVMAIGFAICRNASSTDQAPVLPSGAELVARLHAVDFHSLSGHVAFDANGDRDSITVEFSLYNYQRNAVSGDVTEEHVARYVRNVSAIGPGGEGSHDPPGIDLFVFTRDVHFRNGTGFANLPLERNPDIPPPIKRTYLGRLVALGALELIALLLLCLGGAGWVFWKRKTPAVRKSQWEMLVLICVGCFISVWSIFFFSLDDGSHVPINLDFVCQAGPVFYFLGFQLVFAVLISKTLRIASFFNTNRGLKNNPLRNIRVVLLIISGLVSLQVAILVLWTVIRPWQWVVIPTFWDPQGNVLIATARCTTHDYVGLMFSMLTFGMEIFMLFGAAYAANKTKNLPSQFQESKYIGLAFLLLLQVLALSIPVFAATYQEPVGRYIVLTTTVTFSTLITLTCLILPKMFVVHLKREMWDFRTLDVHALQLQHDHAHGKQPVSNNNNTSRGAITPLANPHNNNMGAPVAGAAEGQQPPPHTFSAVWKTTEREIFDGAPSYEEAAQQGFRWRRWTTELDEERKVFVAEYRKWAGAGEYM